MPVIAIVSEYNPFHNGHFYQLQKIKELFPVSTVISVMSGSLVQRGEPALFSKYNRAEIAVRNGVDAVFELLSVYSNAPANIFAYSAVYIMQKLSGVDYICFGSESGDLGILDFAAEKISGEEFNSKLRETIKSNKNNNYPQNVYNLFRELYGEEKVNVLSGSNNILAIEYLKALKKIKSNIVPLTVKRTGADFNESASYIRKLIVGTRRAVSENPMLIQSFYTDTARRVPTNEIKNLMPEPAYNISRELIQNGKYTDVNNISPAIISHINRLDVDEIAECAEIADFGEAHRLKKLSDGCFDYDSLVKSLGAKHNTSSSVRRMILNIFFGITKEMQKTPPDFTVLLGTSEKGRIYLNDIRKHTEIKIVTKPADKQMQNNKIYEKNLFIDNVCKLALFNKNGEINEIKQKPYAGE